MKRKLAIFSVILLMVVSMLPVITVLAENLTIDDTYWTNNESGGQVTFDISTLDVGDVLTISTENPVTLTGTAINGGIEIIFDATGGSDFNKNVDVTFDNVYNYAQDNDDMCALTVRGNVNDLRLIGDNTIKSIYNKAGINVPAGSSLRIQSATWGQVAELEAAGGNGAGIGGNDGENSGTIIIREYLDIEAHSYNGAGIGGGKNGNADGINLHLDGGSVHAYSRNEGAGIGGGQNGFATEFQFFGGEVYAESRAGGSDIGAGKNGSANGNIYLGRDVAVFVKNDQMNATLQTGAHKKNSDETITNHQAYGYDVPDNWSGTAYAYIENLEIGGGAIYRHSATAATLYIRSSADGELAYQISSDANHDSNLHSGNANMVAVSEGLNQIEIQGLSSGEKYIHMSLELQYSDSDVISVHLPYDIYYDDDFEVYQPGTYPSEYTIYHNGTGTSAQTVIISNDDQMFKLQGARSWCSDQNLSLPNNITSGIVTIEAEVIPVGGSWPGTIYLYSTSDEGIGLNFKSGLINENMSFDYGHEYNVKIVYDLDSGKIDKYVDEQRVNSDNDIYKFTNPLGRIMLRSGNIGNGNIIYYDDVKFYVSPDRTVTYNANGATAGSVPVDSNGYDYEEEVTVLGNTGNLRKTGSAFMGWNSKSDGSGTHYDAGNTFNLQYNTTLYAEWNELELIGESVNRSSAVSASVRIDASTNGTLYYVISDSTILPQDMTGGQNLLVVDGFNEFDLTGLNTGEKYLHMALAVNDSLSEVITIHLPTDYYFCEDFEAYEMDSYPSVFERIHNGSGSDDQKVIDDVENYVFQISASEWTGSHHIVDVPAISTGTLILEAQIEATGAGTMPFEIKFATENNKSVIIGGENGKFIRKSADDGYTHVASDIDFDFNTKYEIKLVYDMESKLFDYYVDGVKANLLPIPTTTTDGVVNFEFSAGATGSGGASIMLYDNVKVYTSDVQITPPKTVTIDDAYWTANQVDDVALFDISTLNALDTLLITTTEEVRLTGTAPDGGVEIVVDSNSISGNENPACVYLTDLVNEADSYDDMTALTLVGIKHELIIEGTNKLISGKNKAGINVGPDAWVNISKSQYYTDEPRSFLEAGSYYGAGIGGNDEEDGGRIQFNGHLEVEAYSYDGAGIGGGRNGDGTFVSVANKTPLIYAYSENDGAGIGGGLNGDFQTFVSHNGGIVFAESYGNGYDIGGGANATYNGVMQLSHNPAIFGKNNLFARLSNDYICRLFDDEIITDHQAYGYTVPDHWSGNAYAYMNYLKINGESIYRTDETSATVNVNVEAGTDCEIHYFVRDTELQPGNRLNYYQGTVVNVSPGLNSFDITGLTSGEQYLYMAIKLYSSFSEETVYHLPANIYFTEDFEAYEVDAYPDSFYIKYDGTGTANQKIEEDEDNFVFRAEGAGGWASEHRVDLPSDLTGIVILKGKVKPISGNWPIIFELGSNSGSWGTRLARVNLNNGYFSVDSGGAVTNFNDVTYNNNQWYEIETQLDLDNELISVYVDGQMLGTEALVLNTTASLDFIEIGAGNSGTSEGYFDEITLINNSVAKYNITYDDNGATTGDVPEDSNDYEEDDTVTVLGNTGSLKKTDLAFVGWNTEDDGSGSHYDAGDTFTLNGDTTLYAEWKTVELTGRSVQRFDRRTAVVRVNASVEGTVEYIFTDSEDEPASFDAGNTYSVAEGVTGFSLTGLTEGEKYFHMRLISDGVTSNITTMHLPSNYYFYEDFEAYDPETYPLSFLRYSNGSGNEEQKIIEENDNKTFRLESSSVYSMQMINLDSDNEGDIVYEFDMLPSVDSADGSGSVDLWYQNGVSSRLATVGTHNGVFKAQDASTTVYSDIGYQTDNWYHVKVVYYDDTYYEYYIDGVKANVGPLHIQYARTPAKLVLIAGAQGEVLFDNIEVYYNPKYQITYDKNGATSGLAPVDDTEYGYADFVLTADNTTPMVKSGYEFSGWNTKADGTGTHYGVGVNFRIKENTKLYAEWDEIKYTVTYHANNADSGDVPVDDNDYMPNDPVTLAGNTGQLIKADYEFNGWNTETDGTGTHYESGESLNINSDLELYAEWKEIIVVTPTPDPVVTTPTPEPTSTPAQYVYQLSLNDEKVTLLTGKEKKLGYKIYPSVNSDASVSWSSLNPNVASVKNGVVTAHSVGTTVITASVYNGINAYITDTVEVTVNHSTWVSFFNFFGWFTGRVVDSNGNPLPWYRIWLFSEPRTTDTNENGEFAFENVEYGNHTLLVYNPEGIEVGRMSINMSESINSTMVIGESGDSVDIGFSDLTVGMELVLTLNEAEDKVLIDEVLVNDSEEVDDETVVETAEPDGEGMIDSENSTEANNWLYYILGFGLIALIIFFVMRRNRDE